MSQAYVKKLLKAPSTASFPYLPDDEVKIEKSAQCTYDIQAYVDSENSFGGTVRTPYFVKIQFDTNSDSWRLKDISFNQ